MNYTEIEILRGIVKDELNVSTRTGIVDKVTDSYVNVRIGHATVLRRLQVIGEISYLQAGSNVIVLSVGGENYCLSSGVFSGSTSLPAGANSYSLGSQYYDKTEINDLLERKSDSGHSHRYDHLEAISGTIGGFEILEDTIRSSAGNFALTSNENATRMVMGSGTDIAVMDGMHATYRFWAGDDDPTTAPFSVEKDGKIHASAGDIAGWDILSDRLSKNSVELNPAGQITVGTGDDVAILGTTQGDWRLWIGDADPAFAPFRVNKTGEVWLTNAHITFTLESDNYEAGVRGWKLDNSGWAELQDVVVRGRIEASVFAETTISAVSGQMVISVGDLLIADVEATATTIQVATDVLGIDDIIQFKAGASKIEWMRVETGSSAVTGGYEYGVVRDLEGAGTVALDSGTACVRKGTATDLRLAKPLASGEAEGAFGALQPGGSGSTSAGGWIVLDGEASSFSVITRQGPVWNQFQTTVRIGNLSGVLDYVTETWGLFIGDDNDYMAYDEDAGLRIQFVGSAYDTTISGAGFVTELMKLKLLSAEPDAVTDHAIFWFNELTGQDPRVYLKMESGGEYEQILGDMHTAVYDTDDDGIVESADNADTVDSLHAASFARVDAIPTFAGGWGSTEGGEIHFKKPETGSSLTGDVIVDINTNKIRFFESVTGNRGAYIDITECAASAASEIWHSGNGGTGSGLDADKVDGKHWTDFNKGSVTFIVGNKDVVMASGERAMASFPFNCTITEVHVREIGFISGTVGLTLYRYDGDSDNSAVSINTCSLSSQAYRAITGLSLGITVGDWVMLQTGAGTSSRRVAVTCYFTRT